MNTIERILLLYLVTVNAAAFLLMLVDKVKAKRNAWRIPEATLMGAAAIGGSIGALAGMYFVLGIPAILIAQIALVIWLAT